MTATYDVSTLQNLEPNPGRGRRTLSDGLTALGEVLSLADIMRLIEQTARWVDPETFRLLPVWFPEHARRAPLYKANWTAPLTNTNRQTGISEEKLEANVSAGKALTLALGLRSDDRPNWTCCHIWGIDDPLFQQANAVVQESAVLLLRRQHGPAANPAEGFHGRDAGGQSHAATLRPGALWLAMRPGGTGRHQCGPRCMGRLVRLPRLMAAARR